MSQSPTSRPVLQPLPPSPVNKRMLPSAIPTSHPNPRYVKPEEAAVSDSDQSMMGDALTPPFTPYPQNQPTKTCADSVVLSDRTADANLKATDAEPYVSRAVSFANTTLKSYFGEYTLDDIQPLGHGVWSFVRRAVETRRQFPDTEMSGGDLMLTPPSSPDHKARLPNRILAIKTPSRRDAHSILKHEARILTYLHQHAAASEHILAFHGWDASKISLVLAIYPRTLEQHVKGTNASLVRPADPVVGRDAWVSLVRSLVSALAFLHNVDCVHGDIKPANVLLSYESPDSFHPLLADFSSSQIIPQNGDTSEIPEISATTTEYTSPELLAAMLRRDPRRAVASFANDVYGLGVTLLEAAVGEKPYANMNKYIKVAMAKEGRVVDFMSGQSRRVGKEVREMVGGACDGKQENRWTVSKWARVLAES